MAKKLVKKQTGGMSASQRAEARRDSLYNAAKARTKARLDSMMKDVQKVNTPTGKDTVRVGTTKITVANKKMGGSTKSKKK